MLFSIAHIDCDAPRATPLSSADILPHARLQLPPLHPLWHVTFFQLETTALLARAPPREPFAPAPADHVLVFTLQYATADHARLSPRYQGFVHARALLAHVPEGPPPAEGDAPTVPWDAWGPAHTRGINGELYLTVFTDVKTRHRVPFLSRDKAQQLHFIQSYRAFL